METSSLATGLSWGEICLVTYKDFKRICLSVSVLACVERESEGGSGEVNPPQNASLQLRRPPYRERKSNKKKVSHVYPIKSSNPNIPDLMFPPFIFFLSLSPFVLFPSLNAHQRPARGN